MSEPSKDKPDEAPLNPALKSRTDRTVDTETSSPAPFDSASAKEGQGEGWPWVWLIVTLAGIVLVIYFVV